MHSEDFLSRSCAVVGLHSTHAQQMFTERQILYWSCLLPSLQVKVTQELKNTHTEQMTRLHFKHQTECDLLEDMRYEDTHPSTVLIHHGMISPLNMS